MPYHNKRFSKLGFTLLEVIVYVALLGVISIFIANNLSQIIFAYNRSRAEREVLNNSRLSLGIITKEIESARAVYAPTSVFNATSSQISLISNINPTAEHATIYLDIYVDNGRLYIKREGAPTQALTSNRVTVTQFRADQIVQARNRETIKITLTIAYNSASSKLATQITLNTSAALRGSY